jgi:hypothetical protein
LEVSLGGAAARRLVVRSAAGRRRGGAGAANPTGPWSTSSKESIPVGEFFVHAFLLLFFGFDFARYVGRFPLV